MATSQEVLRRRVPHLFSHQKRYPSRRWHHPLMASPLTNESFTSDNSLDYDSENSIEPQHPFTGNISELERKQDYSVGSARSANSNYASNHGPAQMRPLSTDQPSPDAAQSGATGDGVNVSSSSDMEETRLAVSPGNGANESIGSNMEETRLAESPRSSSVSASLHEASDTDSESSRLSNILRNNVLPTAGGSPHDDSLLRDIIGPSSPGTDTVNRSRSLSPHEQNYSFGSEPDIERANGASTPDSQKRRSSNVPLSPRSASAPSSRSSSVSDRRSPLKPRANQENTSSDASTRRTNARTTKPASDAETRSQQLEKENRALRSQLKALEAQMAQDQAEAKKLEAKVAEDKAEAKMQLAELRKDKEYMRQDKEDIKKNMQITIDTLQEALQAAKAELKGLKSQSSS